MIGIGDGPTDLNAINHIFTKINRKLSKLCIYLDLIVTLERKCCVDIIYHGRSNRLTYHRWIRVSVEDLISDEAVFFVNSNSYDYLEILEAHHSGLLEIKDRITRNHKFNLLKAGRNASPPWTEVSYDEFNR